MPFEINCLKQQRGSLLKLIFNLRNVVNGNQSASTDTFDIDNLVQVCFQFEQTLSNEPILVKIKCRKSNLFEFEANYTCLNLNVKSDELKYSAQLVCTEQWTEWINIGQRSGQQPRGGLSFGNHEYQTESLDVTMIATKKNIVTFAHLFHDTDLTDFDLSTAEGSVSLHKALLAAHSEVFRTKLRQEWKKTANASIEGVTLQTLKQLKEYIYLDTLPGTMDDLRGILILASHFFMKNLRSECIIKLTQMVKPENLQNLLEFACANNIPELIFAIIEQTPCETVHKARLNRPPKNDGGSGDDDAHDIDDL